MDTVFPAIPPPLDYVHRGYDHVLDLIYDGHNQDKLISVPLEDCRFMVLHGFKAHYESNSPFIQTVKDYIDGTCITYEGSKLEKFYQTFQPKNVQEILDIGELANKEYANMDPLCAFQPWERTTPDSRRELFSSHEIHDSMQYFKKMDITYGSKLYGPVHFEKGKLEFNRLLKTTSLIKENGLRYFSNQRKNITSAVLIRCDEARYYITTGQHRIISLAALKHKNVVIYHKHGSPIIRREDAESWEAVKNGYYTRDEALLLFDKIFDGK